MRRACLAVLHEEDAFGRTKFALLHNHRKREAALLGPSFPAFRIESPALCRVPWLLWGCLLGLLVHVKEQIPTRLHNIRGDAPPPPPTDDVILRVQKSLEALPGLPAERMVDMLEFIATQHQAATSTWTTPRRRWRSPPARSHPCRSKAGVSSPARFARHALGASEGAGNSPEHQLWLLASGAQTPAAICEHGGDAVEFFNNVKRDAGLRGRYLERHFAQAAMRAHLEDPDAWEEAVPRPTSTPSSSNGSPTSRRISSFSCCAPRRRVRILDRVERGCGAQVHSHARAGPKTIHTVPGE